MRKSLILLSLLLIYVFGVSQTPEARDSIPADSSQTDSSALIAEEVGFRFDVSNPRKAIASHLVFLQQETYNAALAAKTLSNPGISEDSLQTLAVYLKDIFDDEGFQIDTASIPNQADYKDTTGSVYLSKYVIFDKYPDIFLSKSGDQWLYSVHTVARIPEIYTNLNSLGIVGDIRRAVGETAWTYMIIPILFILSFFLYRGFYYVARILIQKLIPLIANNAKASFNPKLISPVARPLSLLVVAFLLESFFTEFKIPIAVGGYLRSAIQISVYLFGVMVVYRLIDLIADILSRLAGRTNTTLDDQLIPLVRKIVKMIVGVLGIIFVLQNLGVDVTALLAGVSIGGLALALAAQDTVKNFIGSVSIFVDRPFAIGDFIDTSLAMGTVVEVGVRSTRIRALDGAMVSIPNGQLANTTVTNHSIRTYRRYATSLTVTYATSPAVMENFVERVRSVAQGHPEAKDESVTVQFHEMADSSLNIFLAVIFNLTDYGAFLKARQEVFLAIMKVAEELGVEFAFPSTSVYVENVPEIKAISANKE